MSKTKIEVRRASTGDSTTFMVTVNERGTESRHTVTMRADFAAQYPDPAETVVEAAFRFLLDRESKESILSRFDITVIAKYFPEFPQALPQYLARR